MIPQRYRDLEEMLARGRRELAAAAPQWLATTREIFERLMQMAGDPAVSDDAFRDALLQAADVFPTLWDQLDHMKLAELFIGYQGAAMANGIAEAMEKTQDDKTQDTRKEI